MKSLFFIVVFSLLGSVFVFNSYQSSTASNVVNIQPSYNNGEIWEEAEEEEDEDEHEEEAKQIQAPQGK